jgi:hypothetical protein
MISGGRYLRAFCIGALAPSIAGLAVLGQYFLSLDWVDGSGAFMSFVSFLDFPSFGPRFRAAAAAALCFGLASGLFCVVCRWLIGESSTTEV